MGEVLYSMNVSLDGYIEDPNASIGFSTPDDEVHRLENEQARQASAFLFGRRLYEVMEEPWMAAASRDDLPDVEAEFARAYVETPRIVFSDTLESVAEGVRLVRSNDAVAEVTRLKQQTKGELDLGGASPAFAPVNATWALENRSVAIRVKGLAGAGLHTENRVPCGASNPYLVGAAGLDGIRNRIEPPPATEGLAYGLDNGPTPIPTRLEAALDALEKDAVLRGLMGEELIHLFLAVKRHEVAKATEHTRDYPADDWTSRVDELEVAELFEFL
jgi:hypothetical protein